jgi:hypothetical protein
MPLTSPAAAPIPLGTRSGRLVAPAQIAPVTDMKLTGQQAAICDGVTEGHRNIVVEALAGTGKTSTLVAIAKQQLRRPGVYLAFNKSVQIEAQSKFPDWILVSTAHGLAYQAVGKQYGNRLPGNPGSSRITAQRMATMMRVKPAMLDTGTVNPDGAGDGECLHEDRRPGDHAPTHPDTRTAAPLSERRRGGDPAGCAQDLGGPGQHDRQLPLHARRLPQAVAARLAPPPVRLHHVR